MPDSYISEHSAEFVLVPQFGRLLAERFNKVIPLYVWLSREAGRRSRECLQGQSLYVVALYARRPKISALLQPFIDVKFNDVLFEATRFLQERHIPVFAGVPLASALDDFGFTTPCAWFGLNASGQEEEIQVSLEGELIIQARSVEKLSPAAVLQRVEQLCRPLTWNDAIDSIRALKHASRESGRHFLLGNQYEPVYFVLPA